MILLVRPPASDFIEYPDDVARIRAAMNAAGYDASDADIQWAYAEWSEEVYCASWLSLDSSTDDGAEAVINWLVDAGGFSAPPPEVQP